MNILVLGGGGGNTPPPPPPAPTSGVEGCASRSWTLAKTAAAMRRVCANPTNFCYNNEVRKKGHI